MSHKLATILSNLTVKYNYLLLTLLGVLSVTTHHTLLAQSQEYMIIHTHDGRSYSYPVNEIDSFKFVSPDITTLQFTQAEIQVDRSTEPGEYFIAFVNDTWSESMTLDFYADPTTTQLPSGIYEINESKRVNTICGSSSQITLYDLQSGESETISLISGYVAVEATDDDVYTMTMEMHGDNGKTYHTTLTTTLRRSEPLISTFTALSASADMTGETNTMISFVNAEGLTLRIDFYHKEQTWLPEGDYIFSTDYTEGTISPYSGLIQTDWSLTKAKAGVASVRIADDQYAITAQLLLESGATYDVTYKGDIAGIIIGGQKEGEYWFDTDAAHLLDINDPKAGEFMIKFNDKSWSQEMTIDFYGQSTDTLLSPGTYTYSDSYDPMTFSPTSNISLYAPTSKNVRFASGSTVQVAIEGEIYTITFDLIGEGDQIHYRSQYQGTIESPK